MSETQWRPPNAELERRVLAKVTWRLMPLLMLGVFINYVDRVNIGVASVPMSEDLGLSAAAFGLAAGLFYLGYLVFEIPSNIALARFGARIWLARIMMTWGLCTIALAFTAGEWSLNILRFLVGAAEAGFYPGVLLYLSFWFPARALAKAYALFTAGIPVSLALASVVTAALLLLDGTLGWAGWRWAFLLEGIVPILLAFLMLFLLVDHPSKAKWLSPEERDYLEAQVTVRGAHATEGAGLLMRVLSSGTAWLFSVLYFSMTIGFWSITYWMPRIVGERFDIDATQAGLISSIPWVLAIAAIIISPRTSARTGDRRWHMFGGLGAAAIGLYLGAAADSPVLALIGLSLGAAGFFATIPLFWDQAAKFFAGAAAVVALAMINSLGNVSGLVGPYVLGFFEDLTGSNRVGLYIMCVFFAVAAFLSFAITRVPSRSTLARPAGG
ncbi:MAG: MFS transporter [Pseudonocardiaceae bacterium]|nr:MFS transporter [Pseudonocardiaceae bacterium]